jgi:hypothetical protein
MKIAYLITAYDNPAHFHRLLRAILTDRSTAFVHIDAKSDIAPFLEPRHSNVHFSSERTPVYWGEFSMVEAVLRLIRTALQAPEHFDYFVLLSGSDYPIRPIEELETFLATHSGAEFINIVAMPNEDAGKPLWRLQRYKVLSGSSWSNIERKARQILDRLQVLRIERDHTPAFRGLKPFGGSTWWTMSRAACQYLLDFLAQERQLMSFYRNTWVPEEGLIHTVIGNSPFAARVRRNLVFTDWRAGGNNPAALGQQHTQRFIDEYPFVVEDRFGRSEVFFARKFSDRTAALVDQLDAVCDRLKERCATTER